MPGLGKIAINYNHYKDYEREGKLYRICSTAKCEGLFHEGFRSERFFLVLASKKECDFLILELGNSFMNEQLLGMVRKYAIRKDYDEWE